MAAWAARWTASRGQIERTAIREWSVAGAVKLSANTRQADFSWPMLPLIFRRKFIGYVEAAQPLLEKAGIADSLDEGCVSMADEDGAASFVGMLGELRFWAREPGVDADA